MGGLSEGLGRKFIVVRKRLGARREFVVRLLALEPSWRFRTSLEFRPDM
jgi:hypothetical protein